MNLPRSAAGRIAGGLGALLVCAGLGPLLFWGLFEVKTSGLLDGALKWAFLELGFVFFLYFLCRLIWCLFAPPWMERVVDRHGKHLMIASFVLVLGLLGALIAFEGLQAFGRV